MKISFKEFCGLTKEEQMHLSTNLNEDLSSTVKKKLMVTLDKKLKSHDWWYAMDDDGRYYRQGRKEEEEINKLLKLLGKDGEKLHDKYAKKAGVMEVVSV